MIRVTALLSLLCLPLLATAPVQAQTLVAPTASAGSLLHPASAGSLLHFDTPGHQAAEVTPIQYRRHYHRRSRRHHRH